MKSYLKREFCLLLALLLTVGLVPASVSASSTPIVSYQTHIQNIGWEADTAIGWKSDGAASGTSGQSLRLEGIEVKLNTQGYDLGVTYQTHIQNIGWEADTDRGWKSNGEMSGTSGRGLRLEGIEIKTSDPTNLGVEYQTQVENIGWQGFKSNGEVSGTSGKSLRLEAIQMKLTGADADKYDIYYHTHTQNIGWMGWAKNGEQSGSAGYCYRLEGIEVRLVTKGGPAPGSPTNAFVQK